MRRNLIDGRDEVWLERFVKGMFTVVLLLMLIYLGAIVLGAISLVRAVDEHGLKGVAIRIWEGEADE